MALRCALRNVLSRRGSYVSMVTKRHLPICTMDTNLPAQHVPGTIETGLSRVIADTLNKSEELVSVMVRTGTRICRAGNTLPSVTIHIWSIGVFDAERNPKYTRDIFKFVLDNLDVAEDRIALLFHPITKDDAGHLTYAAMKKSS